MSLHRISHGDGPGTPLLIAHGLYGSARNWGAIAKRLSAIQPVVAVDMRNHGQSPRFPSHSYEDLAHDLAGEIDPLADVLGHSMGGKAAMVLALSQPDKVRKLIVADIAPVAYSHNPGEFIEALQTLDLTKIESRKEGEIALRNLIEDSALRAFFLQSLDVQEKRWRLSLDVLRNEMPKIVGFPDVDGQFEGPSLFLTGGQSDYVLPEHRSRIKSLFPKAMFAKIPNAGHWLHAERPREFVETVATFLKAGI